MGLSIAKIALSSTVLGLDEFNEMFLLNTLVVIDTTFCRAMAPMRIPFTLAINWAWFGVRACFSEFATILPLAFLATKSSVMGDGVGLLSISVATRSGALTKLAPITFAVLWAAMFIAVLLKNFTMFCRALLSAAFSLNSDREGLLLCSNCTIATAILALLSALVKTTP